MCSDDLSLEGKILEGDLFWGGTSDFGEWAILHLYFVFSFSLATWTCELFCTCIHTGTRM